MSSQPSLRRLVAFCLMASGMIFTTSQPAFPQAHQLWQARYDGPGTGEDRATPVVTDAAGNVYVTGRNVGLAGADEDYVAVKYDADGVEQWARRDPGRSGSRTCSAVP